MRLAQATHHDWEGRIACYVDGPVIVARGRTAIDRSRIMLRSILLWAALGFELSWGKVLRGFELERCKAHHPAGAPSYARGRALRRQGLQMGGPDLKPAS